MASPATVALDLVGRYQRNRARSRAIFDLLNDDTYYSRPIVLRHPIVFYEGHLPGFSFNTLVKKALGRPAIDGRLETLFARGIDPHESAAGGSAAETVQAQWPSRRDVRAFVDEADRQVVDALANSDLDRPGDPFLDHAEAAFTILEHEEMHQETLLYMWHRLPLEEKRRPDGYRPLTGAAAPRQEWVNVPAGRATLGVDRGRIPFGWDNEFPGLSAHVDAFAIERHDVTNAQFLDFVEDGGYQEAGLWAPADWDWIRSERIEHPLFWERGEDGWLWRGMFDRVALPAAWPVYVSHAEAAAFACWNAARLPTEAEYQRAAYGSPSGERRVPWGDADPGTDRAVIDFASWDPQPAGSHPTGRSAWGVDDLIGNGWEWTSTVFAPFPGFRPMASYPEYSADFFDGEHFVMKGGSPATARELVRPTFRNWFRARYPYVYATFRCVRNSSSRP
ncbi:MAG TPA: SUMF1/EgtB/PvdO family nonheme iron enzyme [Vicinamibacterales bacterium]|jgi:ergothioneine biosynthesis protein EgtB